MQQGMLLQRPVFKMNPTNEFWDQARVSPQSSTNTLQAAAAAAAAVVNSATLNRANSMANSSHAAATPTSATLNGGAAGLGGGASNAAINQSNMMAMLPPPTKTEPMNSAAPNSSASSGNQNAASSNGNNPRRTPDANCNPNLAMTTFNSTADGATSNTNANSVDNQSMDTSMANQNNMVAISNLNSMNSMVTLPDPKIMTEKLVSELQIFMHKSMQMQLQQRGGGAASVGSSSFGSSGGLEISKPHQCQQCLKSFSSNHQLVQHIRVHTGEKPYKCSYCERRFKQLSHVQQHTRLHTGERPYRCHLAECGRAFIQLSNLQQHLRNHDAQVERAKNRPFHCNICGKGFATESSLRTHAAKETELRMDVLQQHAAMIGGATPTACPICHKLLIGTDALIEHMKYNHKDPNPPPSPLANPYIAKRRTANHPCPVCGKHYVNEGSLRKHLACHPETAQLATSLRMWPCSVCQAVFTHESGLLSHMEHMRMDPKHQFAAQYVLSRAAAERRERESLLAAAALATTTGALPLGLSGNQTSLCPSPSVHSESSSTAGDGRLSSNGSETPAAMLLQNSNNNNNNNSTNNNNSNSNNNSTNTSNNNASSNNNSNNTNNLNNNNINNNNNNENVTAMKLAELMVGKAGGNTNPYINQQNTPQFNADELQRAATALIMSQQQAVAAAAVAAQAVSSSQDSMSSRSPSTAVQMAAANLAAAMRMTQSSSLVQHSQQLSNQNSFGSMPNATDGMAAMQMAMNAAVRASMSSMVVDASLNHQQNNHQSILHQQPQSSTSPTLRMQEVILRSQAEAALRLAVSQAVAASTSSTGANGDNGNNNLQSMHGISTHNMMTNQNTLVNGGQHHSYHHQSQVSPELTEALRLQEQRLEQALRIHGDPRSLGFPFSNAQQHHMNP